MEARGSQNGGGGSRATSSSSSDKSRSNSPNPALLSQDVFHVGKHCEEKNCNRLDFLPVKCDGCRKTFCKEHFRYEAHECASGRRQDNQVPVCPLCNAPVSVRRGQLPDVGVSEHMDSECRSEKAATLQARRKAQVYVHACGVPGCRKKEMLKVDCGQCRQSFCLAHRFPDDHNCAARVTMDSGGRRSAAASRAGAAALARFGLASQSTPPPAPVAANKAQMSQDEALARALQLSLSEAGSSPAAATSQEDEDQQLARALAVSEAEFHRLQAQQQQNNRKANCVMS